MGGRAVAETEHVRVHVIVLHPASQTQDAERRRPAAGQDSAHDGANDVHQTRVCLQKMFLFLQSLLGTHNLGRVHYEPIKDRHGNVLLVTIRDVEIQHSLFSGKWMQVTKLQSQRKSLSTPEEPYALDILIITIQVRKDGAVRRVFTCSDTHLTCVCVCVPGHPGLPAAQHSPVGPRSLPGLPEAQQLCRPDQSLGVPTDPQHAVSHPHTGQRQCLQVRRLSHTRTRCRFFTSCRWF